MARLHSLDVFDALGLKLCTQLVLQSLRLLSQLTVAAKAPAAQPKLVQPGAPKHGRQESALCVASLLVRSVRLHRRAVHRVAGQDPVPHQRADERQLVRMRKCSQVRQGGGHA